MRTKKREDTLVGKSGFCISHQHEAQSGIGCHEFILGRDAVDATALSVGCAAPCIGIYLRARWWHPDEVLGLCVRTFLDEVFTGVGTLSSSACWEIDSTLGHLSLATPPLR